jgi:hypothetical protein
MEKGGGGGGGSHALGESGGGKWKAKVKSKVSSRQKMLEKQTFLCPDIDPDQMQRDIPQVKALVRLY